MNHKTGCDKNALKCNIQTVENKDDIYDLNNILIKQIASPVAWKSTHTVEYKDDIYDLNNI